MNIDASTLLIAATFLGAGLVKGVIGLGLPTVSLAVLTVAFDLTTAMALLLVPSFVTNLWQALAGPHARAVLARCWPFLVAATLAVWIGASALQRLELHLLSALLGALLALYALSSLGGLRISAGPRHEAWAGPLLGTINGVLAGMTGSFVVPGVLYLQAIGLSRDALIQAMGWLFALSTLALAAALQQHGLLGRELGIESALALLPALAGMLLGQRLRRRIPETAFRRLFFVALLLLGIYIAGSAFHPLPADF